MAALTFADKIVHKEVPFLMIEWTDVLSVAAGGELAHGEDTAPEMVWLQQTSGDPVDSGTAVTAKDATEITIDFEDDGNDTYSVYAIFLNQAAGGISA